MMNLPVLLDDPNFVVCIKPTGISSESEGMPKLLKEQYPSESFFCVHRLDQAVSGIMVYAKDGKTAAVLSAALRNRETQKEYLAVVQGVPTPQEGTLIDLLFHDTAHNKTYVVKRQRRGVREASLDYSLLQTVETETESFSLIRILLGTGRSHQIRVQFASRKHPLIGDRRYGSPYSTNGPALFAFSLSFPHPITGRILHFSSLPPELWPWDLFSHEAFPVANTKEDVPV